jgi:ATP-dependent DNA helicase PIF1
MTPNLRPISVATTTSETEKMASPYTLSRDPQQRAIFDEITASIATTPEDALFFVQWPGGTGKTFLYQGLSSFYRAQGKIVLCVASSGIAALLLEGGRTVHSRFKIPIDINKHSICNIGARSDLAAVLRATSLIIWDEVPMQHKLCFEAVNRSLQDIRKCTLSNAAALR